MKADRDAKSKAVSLATKKLKLNFLSRPHTEISLSRPIFAETGLISENCIGKG